MSIVVNVVAWLVFVYDLFVHVRLERHYLRTKVGVFDLVDRHHHRAVVPAPGLRRAPRSWCWPAWPGWCACSSSARRRGQLGRAAWARSASSPSAMLLFCSWMAYVAEHPTNSGVRHVRRRAVVGHRHPDHGGLRRHRARSPRRAGCAGTFLMLTGVATLGVISGTLASAFRSSSRATVGGRGRPADRAERRRGDGGTRRPPTTCRRSWPTCERHLVVLEQHVATLVERSSPSPPG